MIDFGDTFQRALRGLGQELGGTDRLEQQFPNDVWKVATQACGEFREPHLYDLRKAAASLGYKVEISKGKVSLIKVV